MFDHFAALPRLHVAADMNQQERCIPDKLQIACPPDSLRTGYSTFHDAKKTNTVKSKKDKSQDAG
jgi:hypothetical protein